MIFTTMVPPSKQERLDEWRARRADLEHSRSQTGPVASLWPQECTPRLPARGSGIAGTQSPTEHRVEPCAPSPSPPAQGSNSPEPPPPESMQAAHFTAGVSSP